MKKINILKRKKSQKNDLYFVCYMIERVARHLKQKKTNMWSMR